MKKKACLWNFALFYTIITFLASCENKEKSSSVVKDEKNNFSTINIIQPVIETQCEFDYPKKDLFLGFFSGMTKSEFTNHADSLTNIGVLYAPANNGIRSYNYYYNVTQSNRDPFKIKLEAEFLERTKTSPTFQAKASISPSSGNLRIDFEMNADGDNFFPPSFEGFRLLDGPNQSMSSSWMNGVLSVNNKKYTYFLSPLKEGLLNIGKASVEMDDRIYRTSVLKFSVNKKLEIINLPSTNNNSTLKSNTCESLIAIKLIGADELSEEYSSKYSLPKWPKSGIIKQSKIGRYNKAYNPKQYAKILSESKYGLDYKREEITVPMPKKFIDNARSLDLFEEQIYYNHGINKNQYKQTVNIDDHLIVYFVQKFEENQTTEVSLLDREINSQSNALEALNFLLNNISNVISYESQSKQKITSIYFYSRMDVIYTVKKYFYESYKLPEQKESDPPSKIKTEISRDVKNEI